jgi:putative acetyltransferase
VRLSPDITFQAIRPEDIDTVRDLHKSSWRVLARAAHSDAQMKAHEALIDAPDYADALLTNNLTLAWHGDDLVASAGWCEVPDDPSAARIRKVFVDPAVAGSGLGRRIVVDREDAARGAGRRRLTVRANANAEGFYTALGYRPVARGTMPAPGADLPVVFMEKEA